MHNLLGLLRSNTVLPVSGGPRAVIAEDNFGGRIGGEHTPHEQNRWPVDHRSRHTLEIGLTMSHRIRE